MKHKNFDSVHPYGYYLVRKSDNTKYVGIRYANVKKNLTPNQDFGRVYFTSGRLEKEFKKNPENFDFRIAYTFDNIEDLFAWELKIAYRIYKRKDWANQGWGQNYGDNPIIGELISEGKHKVGRDGKNSIERGAETLKDWIWNTDEGTEYRKSIGERVSLMLQSRSPEKVAEVQAKRFLSMDFKAASAKATATLRQVGEDGLTGYQHITAKMHQTKLDNNVYETQGKVFSDWVWNTHEGELYRDEQSARMVSWLAGRSEDERKATSDKLKQTLSLRDEDTIQLQVDKVKATRSVVDDDGMNCYQKAAVKSEQTKLENGTHKEVSKKRGGLFNKKLGEMSEEEFESYCANYIPRLAKSFRTRRNKYLQQVKEG